MRRIIVLCLVLFVIAVYARDTRWNKDADSDTAATQYLTKEGEEYEGEHHEELGDNEEKGYKRHHEHRHGKKGHSRHEDQKGNYDEHSGHKKHHHYDDGHYDNHHHGEKGEEGKSFEEKGYYHKGHSIKGHHGVHKVDEFKKDKDFHDKRGESSFEESYGGHHHEKGYKKGGHFDKGYKKNGFLDFENHRKQFNENGGHHNDHRGFEHEGGHHKHRIHHKHHGNRGNHGEHKNWGWKHD